MDKLVRKIEIPLAANAIKKAGLYIVQEKDIERLAQVAADPVHDHVQGYKILAALRDYQICILFTGLYILLVHRLHRLLILQNHRLQASAPLVYIPLDPAADTNIRIRVHKDLNIHKIP